MVRFTSSPHLIKTIFLYLHVSPTWNRPGSNTLTTTAHLTTPTSPLALANPTLPFQEWLPLSPILTPPTAIFLPFPFQWCPLPPPTLLPQHSFQRKTFLLGHNWGTKKLREKKRCVFWCFWHTRSVYRSTMQVPIPCTGTTCLKYSYFIASRVWHQ